MGVDGLVQQPFVGKCTFGVLVVVGNVAEGSDGTFSGKIDEFPFASPIVWGTESGTSNLSGRSLTCTATDLLHRYRSYPQCASNNGG